MKKLLSTVILAGAMAIPAIAGNVFLHIDVGGPPPPRPVVYEYVYYPEAEVYYVPETRVYWWLSGGTWVSGPHVPSGIVLGARTSLRVDAPDPWRHHDVIVHKFPGHGKHRRY